MASPNDNAEIGAIGPFFLRTDVPAGSGDTGATGATGQKRADLFSNAKAAFVPTTYIEPFGAVAIEAQMAGTPAITTDFGAFTETVEHGKTGYRCHTLDHFVWAAKNVHTLDPEYIHRRAVANYSMDAVRWKYQEYFEMLTDLWGQGWYTVNEIRTQLDWLKPN